MSRAAGRRGGRAKGFRAGLRQRHPLVLVLAALLLMPALGGIDYLFTSGAWTVVPLKYWISNTFDSFSYISWNTGALKRVPPTQPLIALVGGSNARESIWSGEALARVIGEEGGPELEGRSLAGPHQTLGGSIAVIDNLPDAPTTVIVGINLLRLDDTLSRNLRQLNGGELLLESETLRVVAEARYGASKYPPNILPGVFQTLTTRLSVLSDAAFRGENLFETYDLHSTDSKAKLTAKERQAIDKWANSSARLRALKRNLPSTLALLKTSFERARLSGIDLVLVELPHNPAYTGAGFRQAQIYYQEPLRALAAEHDVPYLDFSDDLGLGPEEFHDLDHLLPRGRTMWQARLAKEMARLYRSGAIAGEGIQGGTTTTTPSKTHESQGGQSQ